MMPQGLEPAVEAALLRGVLENQPICLLRLGTDGVVLSANDAAQTLLGADGLGAMLGKVFPDWIASEHYSDWQKFLIEVSQGKPASLQCDLIGPSDTRVPALLHGLPLKDPPDGIRSMGLAVRPRHPEENGAAGAPSPKESHAERQRSADAAERQRLESVVWDLEERLRRLTAEYEATRKRYAQPSGSQAARANERQAIDGLDEQQILAAIRDTTVWHQLEASIAERETVLTQLQNDLTGTQAELERARAESLRQNALWASDRAKLESLLEGHAENSGGASPSGDGPSTNRQTLLDQYEVERESARVALERAEADRERLGGVVHALEARQQQLVAEHAREVEDLRRTSRGERQPQPHATSGVAGASWPGVTAPSGDEDRDTSIWRHLEISIADREEAVKRLERDLSETRDLLERAQADRQRLETALEAASLKEAEARSRAALAAETATTTEREARWHELEAECVRTRASLEEALVNRERLEAALRGAHDDRQRLATVHAAASTAFREEFDALAAKHRDELSSAQEMRAHDAAIAREQLERRDEEVAQIRGELEHAAANQARLSTALHDAQAELQQLAAARAADTAGFAQQLETTTREMDARERQLVASHAAQRADVEALFDSLVARHQSELEQTQADRQRLETERTALAAALETSRYEAERLQATVVDLEGQLKRLAALQSEEPTSLAGQIDALALEHKAALAEVQRAAQQQNLEAIGEHEVLERQIQTDRLKAAAALDQAVGERQRLEATVRDLETRVQRAEAGQNAATRELERARTDRDALATAAQDLQAGRQSHAGPVADRPAEQQRLEAAIHHLQAELRQLEASRAGERVAFDQLVTEREHELQGVLEAADRRQREATDERQHLIRQFEVELATARADLDRERREHERLETLVQECQAQYAQLLASSTSERARLEQRLDAVMARHELDLRAAEESARRHNESATRARQQTLLQLESQCTSARTELERAVADRRQLEVALQQLESRQDQLSASRAHEQSRLHQLEQELASERQMTQSLQQEVVSHIASHRAHLDRVEGAETERARLLKVVADSEVTLHALADHARRLAPLAAAGRVALDVSAQLSELIEEVDRRASRVLALCSLDAAERSELEQVRATAISVAALAHQVLDSSVPPTECSSPSAVGHSQSRHPASRR